MPRLIRLERPPLVEATFEMRFDPLPGVSAEMIFGGVFSALRGRYPNGQKTPSAAIPKEIRDQRPELKYVPQYRLEGR